MYRGYFGISTWLENMLPVIELPDNQGDQMSFTNRGMRDLEAGEQTAGGLPVGDIIIAATGVSTAIAFTSLFGKMLEKKFLGSQFPEGKARVSFRFDDGKIAGGEVSLVNRDEEKKRKEAIKAAEKKVEERTKKLSETTDDKKKKAAQEAVEAAEKALKEIRDDLDA
jgi:hypothetical protein